MKTAQRRLAMALAAVGVIGLLAVLVIKKPWAGVVSGFQERRAQDLALAPLIDQARQWSLSYENVAAGAAASVGKPVVWCVDHHVRGESYVGGNASWKVVWTAEDNVPISGDTKHGCQDMVAVVQGAAQNGVLLEYRGQP